LSDVGPARCWRSRPLRNRPDGAQRTLDRHRLACLEEVINDPGAGQLAFTALAPAPDGTLYAARPLTGEVVALTDSDGDHLPDTPSVVAEGLTLPNGLAYHDGALYISGGSHIYRLHGSQLETLVDDLPSGGGFWTGGIAVADRIYVARRACDFLRSRRPGRGAIPELRARRQRSPGVRRDRHLALPRSAFLGTRALSRGQRRDASSDRLTLTK